MSLRDALSPCVLSSLLLTLALSRWPSVKFSSPAQRVRARRAPCLWQGRKSGGHPASGPGLSSGRRAVQAPGTPPATAVSAALWWRCGSAGQLHCGGASAPEWWAVVIFGHENFPFVTGRQKVEFPSFYKGRKRSLSLAWCFGVKCQDQRV